MVGNVVRLQNILRIVGAALLVSLTIGIASPVFAQVTSYTITARVENAAQGSISPSGAVTVNAGASRTFTVTPNPGYKVAFLQVDGKGQGAISSFTFTNVNADHTISVGFTRMTYTINASSGPNGNMTPNALLIFEHGDSQTFAITPNGGYKVAEVIVDGVPQGPVTSYTFTNIQGDHTIAVNFSALASGGGQTTGPSSKGPGITDLTGLISGEGVMVNNVTAVSGDGVVNITLNRGTSARLGTGQALSQIEISAKSGLSEPPGFSVIGSIYEVLPEAAAIEPLAGLSISYELGLLPAGVSESDLVIVTWERMSGDWTTVTGSVANASTHSVSAPVGRFGRYAVVAPSGAAALAVKDLAISPDSVRAGSDAVVAVTVANSGSRSGSLNVEVKVNGAVVGSKSVTLAPGASERTEFTFAATEVGSFPVMVGGLSGTLKVVSSALPPPVTASTPASSSRGSFSFGMVPGLISAAALVAVLVLMMVRRRESAKTRPAAFEVHDLEIAPTELRVGGKGTASVSVSNSGDRAGSFRVSLRINGSVVSVKDVTLAGGMSDRIEFSVPGAAPGSYAVSVEHLTGTFTVVDPRTSGFNFQSA